MNTTRKNSWLRALLVTLCIYATIPLARPVTDFLKSRIPFGFFINLLAVSILLGGILYLLKTMRAKRLSFYVLLGLILSAYTYFLITIHVPDEKIHFIEYGILVYFIFRALEIDLPQGLTYFLAWVMTGILGWGDEGIQGILPGRYYDIRDVIFNVCGAALGLCVIFTIRREISFQSFKKGGAKPKAL